MNNREWIQQEDEHGTSFQLTIENTLMEIFKYKDSDKYEISSNDDPEFHGSYDSLDEAKIILLKQLAFTNFLYSKTSQEKI